MTALLNEFHEKLLILVNKYIGRLSTGALISSLEITKIELFFVARDSIKDTIDMALHNKEAKK